MELTLGQVGLDLGNSVTKAVATARRSSRCWVEIPTIVLQDADPLVRSEESRLGLLDSLDVTIDSHALAPLLASGSGAAGSGFLWSGAAAAGSGVALAAPPVRATRWQVGGAVVRDRRRGDRAMTPVKGAVKTQSLPILVTGLTALAVLGLQQVSEARLRKTGSLSVRIDILGASLPYSQHNAHKAELKRLLRGEHRLVLHALPGIGEVEVRLSIGSVQTLPEGMPAVLAYTYTLRQGQVVTIPQRAHLLSQPLGVLDAGGGTTDCILFDVVGGRWSLDDSASATLPFGVNDALETAVARLRADGWTRFQNVGALVQALRQGETRLYDRRDGGGDKDLMSYVANEDLRLLGTRVSELLRERWHREIASFLLAGGGARILHQSGYLEMPWRRQPELLPDSEWANAVGNLIYAVRCAERGRDGR